MLKRLGLVFLSLTLTLAVTAFPVNASGAKPGGNCPSTASRDRYLGKTLYCKKVGTKLVWEYLPIPKDTVPTNIYWFDFNKSGWIPKDNLVTSTIQKRIKTLRVADTSVDTTMDLVVEPGVSSDALNSLKSQYKFVVQAFPEVFSKYRNRFFVYTSASWAKNRAQENSCSMPGILDNPPPTMHSEAVPCKYDPDLPSFGSFLNWASFQKYDPAPIRTYSGMDEWANQVGQEGGGSSIQNFYNASAKLGNGNPLPAWYEQGGQDMFTSIAIAVGIRKWKQASLSQGRPYNCNGFSITNTEFYGPATKSCEYTLGSIANELLIALFGFNAPIDWFKVIEIAPISSATEKQRQWQNTFKQVYGVELSNFYSWADSYGRYLATNGKAKLPDDLVKRLKSVKP